MMIRGIRLTHIAARSFLALGALSTALASSACRLGANNTEKLTALKSGEIYDEDGTLAVAITSPADGTLVNLASDSASYAVSGTCSKEGAGIFLQVDETETSVQSVCAQGAWASTLDTTALANGEHSLVALIRIDGGKEKSSPSVRLVKDGSRPTLQILSPAGGSFINSASDSATFSVSGTCSDAGQAVGLSVDGTAATIAGGECNGATWAATLSSLGLAAGSHTLMASISNAAGNSQNSESVVVTKDVTAPTASISSPSNNAYVNLGNNSATYAVSGSCDDSTASVQVQVDGANSGSAVACNGTAWSASISTVALSQGAHTLVARVTDAAGNAASSSGISITKDTAAPTISIASPTASSYVNLGNNSASFAINGACSGATENGRAITVQINGSNATQSGITCGAGSTWSGTFSTAGLSEATHTLTAILADAAGNSTTSSTVAFTKDVTLPTVTLTLPASNTVINPNTNSATYPVKGSCSENGRVVSVLVDGSAATSLASNTCASGAFSATIDVTGLAHGAHTLSATQADAAGNTGPGTPPSVAVTKNVTLTMSPTFSRTSIAYNPYTGAQAASGVPRYVTIGGATGILIEEATTNVLPAGAEDFQGSGWTSSGGSPATVTVTAGQTDPFGGTSAYRVQTSGGGDVFKFFNSISAPSNGTVRALSVWVKNNSATNFYVKQNAGGTTSAVQANGWESHQGGAVTYNGALAGHAPLFQSLASSDNLDLVAMWPMLENRAYSTSYIEPGTQRAAETLSIPTQGILLPTQGAIVTRVYVAGDIGKNAPSVYHTLFEVNDGDANLSNRILLRFDITGNLRAHTRLDLSNMSDINTPLPLSAGWHQIGLVYSATKLAIWVDGQEKVSAANPKLPSALASTMKIGSAMDGSYQLGQPMDYIAFYQRAPSSDEMIAFNTTGPTGADHRLDLNGATFTRSTPAINPADGQLIASNVPKFKTIAGATGVLVEEASTNWFTYPDLSNVTNSTNGTSSLTKETFSIDGVSRTGATLVQGNGPDIITLPMTVNGLTSTGAQQLAFSAWMKTTCAATALKNQIQVVVGGTTYWLNGTGDGWATSTVETFYPWSNYYSVAGSTGTWKKISFVFPASPGAITSMAWVDAYRQTNTCTTSIADIQLEKSTRVTETIRFNGSNYNRTVENLSYPTAGILQASEGAVILRAFVTGELGTAGSSKNYWLFSTGTYAGANVLSMGRDTGAYFAVLWDGSSTQTRTNWASPSLTTGWHTFGMRWNSSGVALWVDGSKKNENTSVSLPASMKDSLYIGASNVSSVDPWNQPIDWVATYLTAPSDAQMDAYTGSGGPVSPTIRYEMNNSLGQ